MRKYVLPEQRKEAQSKVYRLGVECRRGIALESRYTAPQHHYTQERRGDY